MTNYISDLDVSLNKQEESELKSKGFKKIDVNLKQGTGGNDIYLWYKNGSSAITRVQFTFNADMAKGLINAGYTQIPKNINNGTSGDDIYLWYFKGSGEFHTPIVKIDVTTDAETEALKFSTGWETLACNLNRNAGGNWIYAWVKRQKQTYICDVSATASYGSDADNYKAGYIRVDEDTNRDAAGGAPVFIWYRQTTDAKRALTDLKISTDEKEYQAYQKQHYTLVNVDLNKGTGGNQVYLWYKKDDDTKPIQAMSLLLNTDAVPAYVNAGVTVIEKSLNTGNEGRTEYLCFYQPKA